MCDVRGLDVGTRIDVPIALCLSKIDLLTNRIGGHGLELARRLNETVDRPLTLRLLQERSQLCRELLPLIFPDWGVDKALKDYFGSQVLLFPVTSVSLEEDELGQEDLTNRTVAPFGYLEPILWLLHMHGYEALNP